MSNAKMYGFSLENDSLGWGLLKAATIEDAVERVAEKATNGDFDLPCIINAKVVSIEDDEEMEFCFLLAADHENGETYYLTDPSPSTCRECGIPGY